MKCRVRESRSISINEDQEELTATGVPAVYQINRGDRDQTKHSALDRMLGMWSEIGGAEVIERKASISEPKR